MNTKNKIVVAALAGMIGGSIVILNANAASNSSDAKGECLGVNSCKGKGSCKGDNNTCKGQNACKGKGWVMKTQKDCEKLGGTFKEHSEDKM